MTPKDYLHQAYRLDQKISSDLEEVAALHEMTSSVTTPQLSERVQTSKKNDAAFVRTMEQIIELEERINREIELLMKLKREIRDIISSVKDTDERMVLKYRYVHNYTWEQIGTELNADARTVRRWHGNALQHVILPDNPITI
ncbi:DUF1492 domain-containing protein [Butyrivibrio sp. WCD2001]|uniref:DUF1492 domain-containing protein n=1 Tax=Butyrivibrio sp. WCD2001 TaxID=1280681 RepID=UPI0003FE6346|nr:DUF1492 domain-containing protein [Butyrivibrio sp. WCD2001]